jgi:hypothetical protein
MRALTWIVIVGLVLGVVFVFIGFSNPSSMGTLPLAALGVGLISLASTALVVELGVAALRWQQPARPNRPSRGEVKNSRPTDGE